ncbi:MAG: sulfite exporter TauE/SafE family protein [Phycisphaerae bacterium]|nr:sulfite exporter TauE/SafE family protein [Phycisphaerae bacterium]
MTALITAVFLASLLGSLHCVGMCGPFVVFAVGSEAGSPRARAVRHCAYHAGRLTTYALLGAVAGAAGGALNFSGRWLGLNQLAITAAAVTLVVFGLAQLARLSGASLPPAPLPDFVRRAVMAGNRAALQLSPLRRAATIGLLTTLLPCGWLYAFACTAAGTGSAALGALAMSVFWLGTLPALAGFGAAAQWLSGRFATRLPALTSVALIAVGLTALISRAQIDPTRFHSLAQAAQTRTASALAPIEQAVAERPPCCQHAPR